MRRRVSIFYSTTFAKKKSTQTKHVFKILEIITSLRNTHTLHQCVEGSTLNERQVFFICQSGIINNNNNKYVTRGQVMMTRCREKREIYIFNCFRPNFIIFIFFYIIIYYIKIIF